MVDESKIKHIEVRTMASDQKSIQERGGSAPVAYVPSFSDRSEKKTEDKKSAPEPPKIG